MVVRGFAFNQLSKLNQSVSVDLLHLMSLFEGKFANPTQCGQVGQRGISFRFILPNLSMR